MRRREFPGFFSPESEVEALWSNMMQFSEYKAKGTQALVANDPLKGWMYHFLSHAVRMSCVAL